MSLVSTGFVLFLLVGIIVYYIIPKKFQWAWLLIMSYAYYLCAGIKAVGFILATTIITFLTGIILDNQEKALKDKLAGLKEKEEKKRAKEHTKRVKKRTVLVALLLDFGILAVVKYYAFAIDNINQIVGMFTGKTDTISMISILLPLGISFYTFQSVGYIIDVYRGKFESNKNVFKFALFVSYFPQIMQGPIGRYDRLEPQLFAKHEFRLQTIQFGLQRVFWGLFKKFIIADRAAVAANLVFGNPQDYQGVYVIVGVLAYCAELYGDFAGGIDLVMGVSEMLGIRLDDNFRQPFFSKSIGEFWRRWHITLGTWMKDYVFYPFTLSKFMTKLGKRLKKHTKSSFGKHMAKALPICLADLLIFFIVGVWHGAAWKFIMYGMYNGVIIAASSMLVPVYEQMFRLTHINKNAAWYKVFQIIRTFVLVNIGWYFDDAASLSDAFKLMKNSLHYSGFSVSAILDMFGGALDLGMIILGCMVWFVVSVYKEKNVDIRASIAAKRIWIRWPIYLALVLAVLILGSVNEATGGFMYAQF